ncbi:MAG: MATE family efflux transporter [Oscillospiraceae bacterium]|nr:MATE family efflux transporter [Oscillospiraceae bacterium]
MEERRENRLGTQSVGRLLMSMSLPLMVSMFVQALYNIVDGIYVADLSELALTATSLAFPAQMLLIAVALGTGAGTNSLLSRRLGAKDFEGANAAANNGLFLSLAAYVVFLVFGLTLTRTWFTIFTDDEQLIQLGVDYLSVCLIYSAGVMLAVMGERLLQATGKSMLSMVSQISGAVVNIVFDPILIFGRYGFPELGIRGAAIATVMGQFTSAIVSLALNHLKNHEIHFDFKNFKIDWLTVKEIYRVGIPVTVLNAIGSVMNVFMNQILIVFSTTAVAVFGAYYKLNSFIYMPVFGLVQGLVPIVGYNYGARRPHRIMRAVKLANIAAMTILTTGMIIFLLAPHLLLGLFDADENMLAIGTRAFRCICIAFPISAISIVLGNMFQGIGIGSISLINSCMRQIVVLLPSAYLLARSYGLNYVWYSFVIAEVASLIFTLIAYRNVYKKRIEPLYEEEAAAEEASPLKAHAAG